MEGRLIALFATLTVFVASGVQGQSELQAVSHLAFSNDRKVDITRDGCGITKLCLEEPAGCDPTTDDSCLFVSLVATPGPTKGVDLAVELRGKIDQPVGFVGVSLTFKDGSTSLFPCIRNGSDDAPFFRTFWRKNACSGFFLVQNRASGIRIVPKGHVIRCGFDIREVNASVIRDRLAIADTTFVISAATGTASLEGIPGAFIPTLEKRVNVADPTGGDIVDLIGTPAVVDGIAEGPSDIRPAAEFQAVSHLSFSNDRKVDITRDGCGITKLCLEEPAGCDPTRDDSCLFVSLVATPGPTKGVDLAVELRGKIDQPVGFVGVALTFKDGSTSLFPCIRKGSDETPFFRTFWRKNACSGFFLVQNRVSGIRIVPKGHVIRCGFDIREVNASVIRDRLPIADTTFIISAATGTASLDGIPGAFIPTLEKHVNVADPTGGDVFDAIGTPAVVGSNAAATGSNAAAPGRNAAATGNNAAAPGNTAAASNVAHAVPILLSVLALFIMLGA